MAVTQVQLATEIKSAIERPLKDMVEKQGNVGADSFLHIYIADFGEVLSNAIATAIAKAVKEGIVG